MLFILAFKQLTVPYFFFNSCKFNLTKFNLLFNKKLHLIAYNETNNSYTFLYIKNFYKSNSFLIYMLLEEK